MRVRVVVIIEPSWLLPHSPDQAHLNTSSQLFAILTVAFAASPLPLLMQRPGRRYAALAAAAVMATCLALLTPLVAPALAGHVELAHVAWLPAYGLDLSLRLDGLLSLIHI